MAGQSRAYRAAREADEAFNAGLPVPKGAYRHGFARLAERMCLLGATNRELAIAFDATEDAIERWIRLWPRFRNAVRAGREGADEHVAHSMYHAAKGYTAKRRKPMMVNGKPQVVEWEEEIAPNVEAARFWLTNRQRHKWSEKHDPTAGLANSLADLVKQSIARSNVVPGDDARVIEPAGVETQDVESDGQEPEDAQG